MQAGELLKRALARAMGSGDRRLVARAMESIAQVSDEPLRSAAARARGSAPDARRAHGALARLNTSVRG